MPQPNPKTAPSTSEGSVKAAWEALLRGDPAERDRLSARAETQIKAEARSRAITNVLSIDFFVSTNGTAYPARAVFEAGN